MRPPCPHPEAAEDARGPAGEQAAEDGLRAEPGGGGRGQAQAAARPERQPAADHPPPLPAPAYRPQSAL